MNKDVFGQAEDFITLAKISQVFGEVRLGLASVAVFFFFRMNKMFSFERNCGYASVEN